MLRKTAVIAVLILIVSSFTLGSTGRVQTVAVAGNEGNVPAHSAQERGPAAFPTPAGIITRGHAQNIAGFASAGVVQNSQGSEDAARPVAGFVSAGRAYKTPDTNIIEGYVQGAPDTEYSTLVVYLNDTRIERMVPGGFSFVAPGDAQPVGGTGAVIVGTGHVPANERIRSKMAMIKPGASPEFFDFLWERVNTGKPTDPGSFAVFSGHIVIPEGNGSLEKVSQFGFVRGLAAGAIEINGDMVVDQANLPVDVTTEQTNDTYNNQISAGQTNWHSASVDSAVKSVNVDLKWQNPDGKLRLVVYTPDGKVLGPFYDDADGKTDARINLNIANPSGVASGEWHLKVTDMAALGNDDYYVKTY